MSRTNTASGLGDANCVFGPNAPTRRIVFMREDMTAIEGLVYLPNYLRSHPFVWRLVEHGFTLEILMRILKHHRIPPEGNTYRPTTINHIMRKAMKEAGYPLWGIELHHKTHPPYRGSVPILPDDLSMAGHLSNAEQFPYTVPNKGSALSSVPMVMLANNVRHHPSLTNGDGGLLTRCVLYALANPHENLLYPQDVSTLASRFNWSQIATHNMKDGAAVDRWKGLDDAELQSLVHPDVEQWRRNYGSSGLSSCDHISVGTQQMLSSVQLSSNTLMTQAAHQSFDFTCVSTNSMLSQSPQSLVTPNNHPGVTVNPSLFLIPTSDRSHTSRYDQPGSFRRPMGSQQLLSGVPSSEGFQQPPTHETNIDSSTNGDCNALYWPNWPSWQDDNWVIEESITYNSNDSRPSTMNYPFEEADTLGSLPSNQSSTHYSTISSMLATEQFDDIEQDTMGRFNARLPANLNLSPSIDSAYSTSLEQIVDTEDRLSSMFEPWGLTELQNLASQSPGDVHAERREYAEFSDEVEDCHQTGSSQDIAVDDDADWNFEK